MIYIYIYIHITKLRNIMLYTMYIVCTICRLHVLNVSFAELFERSVKNLATQLADRRGAATDRNSPWLSGWLQTWVLKMENRDFTNNWLVVWIFFIFPYIGNNNHPNWLIFFRGVETTNQITTGQHWDIMGLFNLIWQLGVWSWQIFQCLAVLMGKWWLTTALEERTPISGMYISSIPTNGMMTSIDFEWSPQRQMKMFIWLGPPLIYQQGLTAWLWAPRSLGRSGRFPSSWHWLESKQDSVPLLRQHAMNEYELSGETCYLARAITQQGRTRSEKYPNLLFALHEINWTCTLPTYRFKQVVHGIISILVHFFSAERPIAQKFPQ